MNARRTLLLVNFQQQFLDQGQDLDQHSLFSGPLTLSERRGSCRTPLLGCNLDAWLEAEPRAATQRSGRASRHPSSQPE